MPERESDRLSGRVRRYARVGTSVGGIAARMAGQRYLGLPAPTGSATPRSSGAPSAASRGR